MWVIVIWAQFVQVEQRLVHTLLKLQGAFESLHPTAPLVPLGLLQRKQGQELGETLIDETPRVNEPEPDGKLS